MEKQEMMDLRPRFKSEVRLLGKGWQDASQSTSVESHILLISWKSTDQILVLNSGLLIPASPHVEG